MKKLMPIEQQALDVLVEKGSICLGDVSTSFSGGMVQSVLDSLVKKKRAYIEPTDDSPRYHPTAKGQEEANG